MHGRGINLDHPERVTIHIRPDPNELTDDESSLGIAALVVKLHVAHVVGLQKICVLTAITIENLNFDDTRLGFESCPSDDLTADAKQIWIVGKSLHPTSQKANRAPRNPERAVKPALPVITGRGRRALPS